MKAATRLLLTVCLALPLLAACTKEEAPKNEAQAALTVQATNDENAWNQYLTDAAEHDLGVHHVLGAPQGDQAHANRPRLCLVIWHKSAAKLRQPRQSARAARPDVPLHRRVISKATSRACRAGKVLAKARCFVWGSAAASTPLS